MIRASNSGASNASKRVPFTVPAVPTGIKTGVSINARLVCNNPTRASPSCATTCQLIAVLLIRTLRFRRRKTFQTRAAQTVSITRPHRLSHRLAQLDLRTPTTRERRATRELSAARFADRRLAQARQDKCGQVSKFHHTMLNQCERVISYARAYAVQ